MPGRWGPRARLAMVESYCGILASLLLAVHASRPASSIPTSAPAVCWAWFIYRCSISAVLRWLLAAPVRALVLLLLCADDWASSFSLVISTLV